MKTIEIKGKKRTDLGKKATKALRKEGFVPCVVYGGKENIHFCSEENELRKIIFTPEIFAITIDLDGEKVTAIAQDMQFHPVTDNVLHIDFYEVDDKKPVKVAMPVILEGLAAGVKDGGQLILNRRKLRVKGLISQIPDNIKIDVTELTIGKSIKIGALSEENIEFLGDPSRVVCSVKMTRSAMSAAGAAEDEEEEGAAEGAEGEEAQAESAE